ncbi:hypothetical protein SAMD00019534_073410 [Acytostelium subglobosum LB1]|uniref:hypothetical protein n=1 Tax=Acytostelium subglobosum LB1 TaxID=1410327 RepID=UPI00064520E8|nr:hypothetical protein SAMD00019534_073410 [Acytostelium subglobosum LB1]GAM24166.1 hypothetical protein SAMD00019534_073410 [Acytostelium subglobosum LB1]|eukprot:XP_012753202.1 hypothetical protein SAMD00019534_073410 [Acytostelium subglobosum LB1]
MEAGTQLDTNYFYFQGQKHEYQRDMFLEIDPTDMLSPDHTTKIWIRIPPGYGQGSFPVWFSIENQYINLTSPLNETFVQYYRPSIYSATPLLSDGGWITLTGANYYNTSTLLNVTIGVMSCTNVIMLVPHYKVACYIPDPVGEISRPINITVELGGQINDQFEYQFSAPQVLSANSGFANTTTLITINGNNFGTRRLSVTIGPNNEPCYNLTYITSSRIQCYFDGVTPQIGNTTMNITVTSGLLSGINQVFYYNPKQCPMTNGKQCNDKGACVLGTCRCDEGWTLLDDCSKPGTPGGVPTIINGTVVNPSNVNFTSAIIYLRESDQIQNTVRSVKMSDVKWTSNNVTGELNGTLSENVDPFYILINITLIQQAREIEFAGETLYLEPNSVKFTISIHQWKFASTLNTLELIFESRTAKQADDGCSSRATTVNTSDNQLFIEAGTSVFIGSFASHMYVDGRVVTSNQYLLDATDPILQELVSQSKDSDFVVAASIPIPHFNDHCLIDPTFQSLIVPSETNCGLDRWKIILIAVLCGAFVVCVITAASIFLYKLSYKYVCLM